MQSWKVPSMPCSFSVQKAYWYTSRKEMEVERIEPPPHSVFVLHKQNKLVRVFLRGEPARRMYPILLTGLRELRKKVRQLYVYLFRIYE
jgi:hypothetical protein